MLCEDPVVGPPLLGSAHVMGGEHRVFLSKDIHGLLKSKALLVPAAERGLVWGSTGQFGCGVLLSLMGCNHLGEPCKDSSSSTRELTCAVT